MNATFNTGVFDIVFRKNILQKYPTKVFDKNTDKSIFEEWPTKSGPCRTNMQFFSSRRLPLRYFILNCIYS